MAPLVVNQAGVLRLIWAQGGVPYAVNVLGVVNAGNVAITQALTNTIGTAVKAGFTSSNQGAVVHSSITLVNVGLRDIRTANQPEFLDSGAPVAGTATGDLLPPQVAFVITLRTALAGKSFRGRTFLPGYSESSNAPTGVNSNVNAGPAFLTTIKSALVSSGLDLGVLSRPNPAATPPNPGHITAVTSMIARDAIWDTQRRRAVPGI